MANWVNARLIVVGRRDDVQRFARVARERTSTLFSPDMASGEGDDLHAERMEALERGFAKKEYRFQIRNDDGRTHFGRVSKGHPELFFVLVYFDPNVPPSGSFFISRGRARSHVLPDRLMDAVMAKHGVVDNSDDDSDDDIRYWEASWELMDLAEAHWKKALERAIRG
jgi:hypothetical protein